MSTYGMSGVFATITGPDGSVNLGAGSGVSDEGITIERTGDINVMQMGSDGTGQHSLLADRSGTVMVHLLKTSPTNFALMNMYNFQTSSPINHGRNVISVSASNGDSHVCTGVAFKKCPNIVYTKEAGMNTWEFSAISIETTLGSNLI